MDKTNLATVAFIGAAIGVGQLMLSSEPITVRRAVGRAIVTAGLSVSAFAVIAVFPALSTETVVGMACAIASLGTSGLERIVARYLDVHPKLPPVISRIMSTEEDKKTPL